MKTPLLLLHGALGAKNQMETLSPYLSPAHTIYALDFPGHGGSLAKGPFSIPYFGKTVLDFLDRENIQKTDIFGYSMGGYVALYLAWKYPDRVRRMVTLGTKFDWNPDSAAREAAMLDPERIALKVPHFAETLAQRHAPLDWKSVLHQTAELLQGLGNGNALPEEAFDQIHCPVTILLGEADNMVTLVESQQTATALANGRFEILPGTKHPIEQVDPKILAAGISDALQERF